MVAIDDMRIPEALRDDLKRAARLLREGGCTGVFLFGSTAAGQAGEGSDLDLAVRGCPAERFFELWGRLAWELGATVDLIRLEPDDAFARYLEEHGELLQVA